jgi:hypothetical protein
MRLHVLIAFLVGLAVAPGWARAQIKLPVFEDDAGASKNIVFEEANQVGDFQHGKLLRVTGTDGKTVQGILVRVDRQKHRLFLRTTPGAVPVAIAEKDVKKVEKGVIKDGNNKQDYTRPEIQATSIINGTKQNISFSAPTLSSGELAHLRRMETGDHELNRLEQLAAREAKVLEEDMAIQTEQRKTQELLNAVLFNYNLQMYDVGPVPPFPLTYAAVPWLSGNGQPWGGVISTLPSALRQGPTVFPGLPVSHEALAKARDQALQVQNRGVYEDGRLVAVILEEQEK